MLRVELAADETMTIAVEGKWTVRDRGDRGQNLLFRLWNNGDSRPFPTSFVKSSVCFELGG